MTDSISIESASMEESSLPLAPHWIQGARQAQLAAKSNDRKAVWIIRKPALMNRVVRGITWPSRRAGFLVLMGDARSQLLPALERKFLRVVYAAQGFLPRKELEAVFKSRDREDRFVGGLVDKHARIVTLWRGDLTSAVVPFSAFPATANGIRPDWNRFTVTDFGHTLKFGNYEAATDAILYDYDPEFRRRYKKALTATEQTLGASIRRLRKQRQLTRHDFPNIDPKTLARIERGAVQQPHADTLKRIAARLGVTPAQLGTF